MKLPLYRILLLAAAALVLLGIGLLLGALAGQPSQVAERTVVETVVVTVPVPVVQTQVVEVTRDVPQTVVVTATPSPTPAYASRVTVPEGTLAYPLSSEPASIDPQEAPDEVAALVVQQLYEGLYAMRGDGSLIPAAATGYRASADGKVYTITLRSDMTWSDGQPVTAGHFVDGMCRTLDPATGSPYYTLLTEVAQIAGARDFGSGLTTDCKKVGVSAADDLTLVIRLERPAGFFPKMLAAPAFLPARRDVITGARVAPSAVGDRPAPVTNGPYTLAEWVPKDHLTLVKNPSYWNASQVAIGRIEFPIIPDSAGQLRRYERGELHVAEFPSGETARIQADPAFAAELQVLVRPGTSYIGLNTRSGPTANVAFRRAIASAIDRDRLIKEVLQQPWHQPARVVVPPNIPGYQGKDPTVGYPYDPAAAARFLAEAGYGPGNPAPAVELWTNREGNNEAVFKAVSGMLEQIGIPVRLATSPWNVYLGALNACSTAAGGAKPAAGAATRTPTPCSYNLYRMGWVMDYADPAGILDAVFSPKSAFQYTGWESKEYEDLLAKARAESDEAKRAAIYQQAEKILLNDAVAVVPLMHYDRTILVKAGVAFDYPPFGAPNLQFWK